MQLFCLVRLCEIFAFFIDGTYIQDEEQLDNNRIVRRENMDEQGNFILNQYRGKHIHAMSANEHLNGTWVYGYLAGKNYIHVDYEDGMPADKLVDENTVGLCSGQKDKNGIDIYQGDILENKNGVRFEVRYGKYAMYCPVDGCMMENVGFFVVADGFYEDMPLGPTEDYAVVIGNVFDNPKLRVDEKFRCQAGY